MNVNRAIIYEDPAAFFDLGGSVVMKLSPDAAAIVCLLSASKGLVVARIEGGLWDETGFEARLDCIWDGLDPPTTINQATLNNRDAAVFVLKMANEHQAFIVTTFPLAGYDLAP